MNNKPSPIVEVTLVLLVFAGTALISAVVQQPTAVGEGKGWDGVYYYATAEQFAKGSLPTGTAPFIHRIGTPFLAALVLPQDLIRGFLFVNVAAAGVTTLLLVIWLRMYLSSWILRFLLVAAFVVQWNGSLRYTFFCPPTSVDPAAMAFCVAGLVCIGRLRSGFSRGYFGLLCVVALLGPLFREFAAFVGWAAVFMDNPLSYDQGLQVRRPALRSLVPLGCSAAGVVLSHVLVTATLEGPYASYSYVGTVGQLLYYQPLAMYVHAWLISYGPLLFLLFFGWRTAGRFLWENQFQLAFFLAIIGLSLIGGHDTERFVLWAAPITYLLIGVVIEREWMVLRSALLLGFIAVTQALSARLFWTIPDEWGGREPSLVIFSPITNASYLNLWSYYGPGASLKLSLLQYAVVGVVILMWLLHRQTKLRLRRPLVVFHA